MRFLGSIVLIFAFVAVSPHITMAQGADGSSDLAANAAVQYWQAFAQMPVLDKDQQKLLEQWNTVPLDAAAQKLIAESQSSLMYLHRGAKLERCDWGLDYNDGISMLLPHVAKARDLARLAALHARSEFDQGRWKSGRQDATSMMALARHIGKDPLMIVLLVEYSIEGMTVDVIAPYVPDLKAPYAQAVAQFESLPKAATLAQSVVAEKKFVSEWMVAKLKEEERRKKGGGLEMWKKIMDGPEIPDSLSQVKSFAEVLKMTEELAPVYDELAKFVVMSKDDFDSRYPEFKQKTKAVNPMAGYLVPVVDQIVAKRNRNQVRMEMLLAAIAVAESGPSKLKDFKDPFGNDSFEYRALDKGFELKSKLVFEDHPVTLTVGNKK